MKENRKLLKEVLKDIRHDMTDEEVLNLLADSKISVSPEKEKEKYTLGQRAADTIAKFAGSWAFIFSFTGGLILWMVINTILASKAFDAYPFILLNSQTNAHDFYLHFFSEHGVSIKPDIEVVTTDQILPMIKYDLGIGFLPEQFAMDALMKKEVFQILMSTPLPPRSICLVKNPSQPASIAAREFEKMLRS